MAQPKPRVGIVGSGVSGLATAWMLGDSCEIELFQGEDRIGGHIYPVDAEDDAGRVVPVDTGFLGFKRSSYPNIDHFMSLLGVESMRYDCSLSVWLQRRSLLFRRSEAHTLFGRELPQSVLAHYDRFRDLMAIVKKNGLSAVPNVTIAEFLRGEGAPPELSEVFIIPDVSTIWGIQPDQALRLSLHTVFGSLLTVGRDAKRAAPSTAAYLERLLAGCTLSKTHRDPVVKVVPLGRKARVETRDRAIELDAVVVATHADDALRLLDPPTSNQRTALGAIEYIDTSAVIHSDTSLLPPNPELVANFNYAELAGKDRATAVVTWDLNRIFNFKSTQPWLLSTSHRGLADSGLIAQDRIRRVINHRHCLATKVAVDAMAGLPGLNASGPVYFCGSYFKAAPTHEAAFTSALDLSRTLHANLAVAPARWTAPPG